MRSSPELRVGGGNLLVPNNSGDFAELDQIRRRAGLVATPAELQHFGRFCPDPSQSAHLVEIPPDVLVADYACTNPAPLQRLLLPTSGEERLAYATFFREERRVRHLGSTNAVLRLVNKKAGRVWLTALDVPPLPGEDPRLAHIQYPGALGSLPMLFMSTVGVEVEPKNPDAVTDFGQQFWMGPSLDRMEPVAKGPSKLKNTTVLVDDNHIAHIFVRPQPECDTGNISYISCPLKEFLKNPEQIILEANGGKTIDDDLYPYYSGFWGGPNNVMQVGPGRFRISAHKATGPARDGTKFLNYQPELLGFDADERRICALGTFACRSCFPEAEAKPETPDGNGRKINYHNVAYGGISPGIPWLITGVGDNRVGLMKLLQEHGTPLAPDPPMLITARNVGRVIIC